MAKKKNEHGTDNPLKRLFMTKDENLTTWLLGQPILEIKSENIELPVSTLRTDQVYEVTLADGKEIILHCEFEAGSSTEVMSWRMEEYMHRIARRFKKEIYSVVIYLQGKGKGDTGTYKLGGVSWNYRVIHLWDIKARELLDTQNPALAAMVGSAKLEEPRKELEEAIDTISQKTDNGLKTELLSVLVALIEDERLSKMIENQLTQDFPLDSPFIRRMKDKGREEGREEGRDEERSMKIARNMRQKGMSTELIAELNRLKC